MNNRRSKWYKEQNGKCAFCGGELTKDNLSFEHLIPKSIAGKFDNDNIILVCRNCNLRRSDKMPFSEVEFSYFIRNLLDGHPNFRNISQESLISPDLRYRADLLAEEKVSMVWNKVLIEIKSVPTFTTQRLHNVVEQLKSYKKLIDRKTKMVLCFPGLIPETDIGYLNKFGIEIWDRDFLIDTFGVQISNSDDSLIKKFFTINAQEHNIEEHLLNELKSIAPGRENWSKYQKYIGKVLSYLFSDELSDPITELSDKYGINRRDFILRNYCESGFWKYLRETYQADFIVIDAKNYTGKIKKNQILQISNYLKSHGAGLFAIIISRNGEEDKGAYFTRREIWATENKMIIILSDNDMEKMILAKASSNLPEEIIIQKIEGFRLEI